MEREKAPKRLETAGEARSTKERGADLCKHAGLTYSEFLAAAKAAMPEFKISDLNSGKYSHEQMDLIEAQATHAREEKARRPSTPEVTPTPAPERRPRTPVTPEVVPDRSSRSGQLGKTALSAGMAVAVGAGVLAGALGVANNVDKADADTTDGSPKQEETQADELAEAHEAGESFDISDDYRGRYADETGNYTNPNKIGRNGQEAPYNFGEAYEYTTEDAFRQEIQEIAKHEPAMFAAWYYDLDDSVKVPGTENMSMAELQDVMREDDDMHRKMVEQFISITDGASFAEDTITGEYTNVFARTTGGNGEQITSDNTESVHCTTHEDGSKVVVMTYKIGKDKTATITFREGCGLQNVRLVGTPESEKIITTTPEIPTPEPDEPSGGDPEPTPDPTPDPEPTPDPTPDPEPTPDPTPDPEPEPEPTPTPETPEKTPFDEEEVFRDDDAGDTWEPDPGAITEDTITEEPEAPAQEDFHEDTGNYEEPEAPSQDSQDAAQDTADQIPEEVQEQREEAHEEQQAASQRTEENNQANDEREVRSEEQMADDLADYANDDGTINPDDIPYQD